MDTRATLLVALCFVAIAAAHTLSKSREDVEVEEHRLAASAQVRHDSAIGSAAGESSNKWRRSLRATADKTASDTNTKTDDTNTKTDTKADGTNVKADPAVTQSTAAAVQTQSTVAQSTPATTPAPSGVAATRPAVCALVTSIALAILLH